MFKFRLIILAFILVLSFKSSVAQSELDYKLVDSLTLKLYNESNWQSLENFGIQASKKGYDFYYLNLRTAVAAFNLEHYIESEKFFKKALKNNSASDFAKENLFWTYYNLGNRFSTNDIYKKMIPQKKNNINYRPARFFDYMFFECGKKYTSKLNSENENINYFNFGLNHFLSPNVSITESYTYIKQNQSTGNYIQQQFFVNSNINLHNNKILSISAHGLDYLSTLDYYSEYKNETSDEIYTDTGIFVLDTIISGYDNWQGKYQQQLLIGYIGFSDRINRVKFGFNLHYIYQKQILDYTYDYRKYQLNKFSTGPYLLSYSQSDETDTIVYDYTVVQTFYQPGVELSFYPRTLNDGLQIGGKLNAIFINPNEYYFVAIPFIEIKLFKRFTGYFEYLQKGQFPLAFNEGFIILNNLSKTKTRITSNFDIKINDDLNFYTTYLFEKINDSFTNSDYRLNSLIIGIKLKFN